MRSRLRAGVHVALGGLLVLVALGGWQVAARASAASTPTVISGCYDAPGTGGRDDRGRENERGKGDESTGALRIVRAASDCKRGETFIQWNQAGVPGPQGVAGPTGPAGPVGPTGALPSVSCPSGQFLTGIAAGVAQCASTSTVSGYALSLMVQGDGTVTSNPPGINCTVTGGTCSATFGAGTTVELLAQPAVGAALISWFGPGCAGSTMPQCSVTMTSARNLTAIFSVAPQAGLFKVTPADPITFGPGATKTYQITNAGTAASGPISVTLSSPNFHIAGVNGCQGVSLAVGASCSFAVTFVLPPEGFPVYFEEAAFAIEASNAPVLTVAMYAEYPVLFP
jgi:hypothetical protein